jgi:hypothetical protein
MVSAGYFPLINDYRNSGLLFVIVYLGENLAGE